MGCFSLHKVNNKKSEEEGEGEMVSAPPPSLKKGEWMVMGFYANPRLLSSHPGYGTPQEREKVTSSPSSSSSSTSTSTTSIKPAKLLYPQPMPMPLPHPSTLVTTTSNGKPSLVSSSSSSCSSSRPNLAGSSSSSRPSLAGSSSSSTPSLVSSSSTSSSKPSLISACSSSGGGSRPSLVTATSSNSRPGLVTRSRSSSSGGGSRPTLVATTISSFCRCSSSRPSLVTSSGGCGGVGSKPSLVTTSGSDSGSRPTLVTNSSSDSRPTLVTSSNNNASSSGGGASRPTLFTTTSSSGGSSSNNNSSSRSSLVTTSNSGGCGSTLVNAICCSSTSSSSRPTIVTTTSSSASRPTLVTSTSGGPGLLSSSSASTSSNSVFYHLPLPHLSSNSSSSSSSSRVDVMRCLDWAARVKIAMGVAQELAYLHRTFPNMVSYREFRTNHIHVDYDFSAKLSGYYSIEELESGHRNYGKSDESYCPFQRMKSNVWSFGIVLLELMSGRGHMDPSLPIHERNLVEWALPFLVDEGHLFLAMDPKLHGMFPLKPAKMVAKLAIHCLHPDPQNRPTMCHALDILRTAHVRSIRCSHAIKATPSPSSSSSTSTTTTIAISDDTLQPPQQRHTYVDDDVTLVKRKHPTKDDLIKSPPLRPLVIPNRVIPNMSCSSMYPLEDRTFFSFETQETF